MNYYLPKCYLHLFIFCLPIHYLLSFKTKIIIFHFIFGNEEWIMPYLQKYHFHLFLHIHMFVCVWWSITFLPKGSHKFDLCLVKKARPSMLLSKLFRKMLSILQFTNERALYNWLSSQRVINQDDMYSYRRSDVKRQYIPLKCREMYP